MSADSIKELREATSCGIMDCKRALDEAKGDMKKARELLRERGLQMALKKADWIVKEGRVEAYIHNGSKIGVLLEVNCETDFVARSDDFIQFTRDVAIHIAAMAPKFIKKDDVPAGAVPADEKPDDFVKVHCLLAQPFVKDSSKTVGDLLNELVAKIGENIVVNRFIRYKIGE